MHKTVSPCSPCMSILYFDQLVESKQEVHENFVEMSRNNHYTTGN